MCTILLPQITNQLEISLPTIPTDIQLFISDILEGLSRITMLALK